MTGASGLVGSAIVRAAASAREPVIALTGSRPALAPHAEGVHIEAVDLTVEGTAEGLLSVGRQLPRAIVHGAALTDVDRCEKEPELAWRINVDATARLAEAAARAKVPFLLLSSHGVFDGARGDYRETDEPSPINVHFRTKVAAEKAVLAAGGGVVRIVPIGVHVARAATRTFGEWLVAAIREDRDVSLYRDVRTNPTTPARIADFVLHVLRRNGARGILHLGSRDVVSKADIGLEVARAAADYRGRIRIVSIDDAAPGPAARPKETWVATDATAQRMDYEMPPASEVVDHLRQFVTASKMMREPA